MLRAGVGAGAGLAVAWAVSGTAMCGEEATTTSEGVVKGERIVDSKLAAEYEVVPETPGPLRPALRVLRERVLSKIWLVRNHIEALQQRYHELDAEAADRMAAAEDSLPVWSLPAPSVSTTTRTPLTPTW
ncbi:uncharacterized protein AMSG_05474 [Thecamonas trahens ATCC 50062]|uniref:Uncharacterized protein n=1 Tax=Thecamonas trahens ATCC 50062 TaxID=461836 RepID=A0A0L0DAT0_THETB|nr:hypothetical protein AMSG_05474 [Thecamonas trahens ATCC 50062]KNC49464.1 hypothetical protein AMSG_05474 [Thecamonas trahens ATCC 50062]|eukprot:XP_013757883.1 hypothetical protein AMSG_05474 [Thecamonas trahens ATCC 50062]